MTKFTKQQKMIVAAMFARTNMGQPNPTVEQVRRQFTRPPEHLSTPVMAFCEQYMETDEHQRIFMAEARSWMRDKNLSTLEAIQQIWPDVGALIESAMRLESLL